MTSHFCPRSNSKRTEGMPLQGMGHTGLPGTERQYYWAEWVLRCSPNAPARTVSKVQVGHGASRRIHSQAPAPGLGVRSPGRGLGVGSARVLEDAGRPGGSHNRLLPSPSFHLPASLLPAAGHFTKTPIQPIHSPAQIPLIGQETFPCLFIRRVLRPRNRAGPTGGEMIGRESEGRPSVWRCGWCRVRAVAWREGRGAGTQAPPLAAGG